MALVPVLLAGLVFAQARFGLLEDRQGRLLGVIAPNNDLTADKICWDEVASELERRGLLTEPRTFLFTDSWDRSAGLALATRGKAPVACYHLEPRSYSFWSRPEDWVGRDGIFVESERAPAHCLATTDSSCGMNRSAACESSAAVLSFARSIFTAAPIKPAHSPSTAACESSLSAGSLQAAPPRALQVGQSCSGKTHAGDD